MYMQLMVNIQSKQGTSRRFHGLKKVIGLFMGISLSAISAHAYYNLGAFWTAGNAISFSPPSNSGVTHQCLSSTIQRSSSAGTTTVNLSGTGATFYTDSLCSMTTTSVVLGPGALNQIFYLAYSTAGTRTITATATGLTPVTQTEIITLNPFTWTGLGGNANWTTPGNWSGNAAPGSSDNAVFDGVCSSNCSANLTADTTTGGIGLYPPYSATVSMNGHNLTLANALYIAAGTFTAGVGTLNTPNFVSTGGTFTASTGTTVIPDSNNSTVSLVTPVTFNNFSLGQNNYQNVYLSGTANVAGNLTFAFEGCCNGYGPGTIIMNGTTAQTVTDANAGAQGSMNVNLTLANSSGVTFNSSLLGGLVRVQSGSASFLAASNATFNSFELDTGATFTSTTGTLQFGMGTQVVTFQSGSTFNANGGTVLFSDGNGATGYTFASTPQFHTVILGRAQYGNVPITGSFNVNGNLTYNEDGCCWVEGSGTITLNGTGAQTVIDTNAGTSTSLNIDLVTTNSGSGVTFSSAMTLMGLTVQSGTASVAGAANITIQNLQVNNGATLTASTGNLTVMNTATFQSGSTYVGNGGTFTLGPDNTGGAYSFSSTQFSNFALGNNYYGAYSTMTGTALVSGNLTLALNGNGGVSGTGGVVMNGTGAQNVTDSNSGAGGAIGVTLNTANSGTGVTFNSKQNISGAVTIQSGIAKMTGTYILIFNSFKVDSGATFQCNGNCGAGTACGLGTNKLRCTTYSNSGTITP